MLEVFLTTNSRISIAWAADLAIAGLLSTIIITSFSTHDYTTTNFIQIAINISRTLSLISMQEIIVRMNYNLGVSAICYFAF
jgi:hypothetical protein